VGAVAGLGVVVVSAAPASAKGPESATITGPGLDDPIELSIGNDGFNGLDTGVWNALPDSGSAPLVAKAPPGDLGDRYVITWQMMINEDETTPLRQELYLDAEGGAVAYTPAGQPFFDVKTVAGWYRVPPSTVDAFAELGVPVSAKKLSASTAGGPPVDSSTADSSSAGRAVLVVGGVGLAAAAAGLVGVVATRRARRRQGVAPTAA
jgi:hypothetical protein